jgi:hypothetical protein
LLQPATIERSTRQIETGARREGFGDNNRADKGVEATLNYIAETAEKPVYYAYEPPAGIPRQTGRFLPQKVLIRDGRAFLDELSLDQQGFELSRHETSVRDFYDREEVQKVYYPEVERCLKGRRAQPKS